MKTRYFEKTLKQVNGRCKAPVAEKTAMGFSAYTKKCFFCEFYSNSHDVHRKYVTIP